MSFLNQHVEKVKTVNVLGKDFDFKSPSSAQYLSLMTVAQTEDIQKIAELTAEIIESNLIGEEVTKEQVLSTFSFDEMFDISYALVTAFNSVDEAGKQ